MSFSELFKKEVERIRECYALGGSPLPEDKLASLFGLESAAQLEYYQGEFARPSLMPASTRFRLFTCLRDHDTAEETLIRLANCAGEYKLNQIFPDIATKEDSDVHPPQETGRHVFSIQVGDRPTTTLGILSGLNLDHIMERISRAMKDVSLVPVGPITFAVDTSLEGIDINGHVIATDVKSSKRTRFNFHIRKNP